MVSVRFANTSLGHCVRCGRLDHCREVIAMSPLPHPPRPLNPRLRALNELDRLYCQMVRQLPSVPTRAAIDAFYREHTPHPPPSPPASSTIKLDNEP
jgi:hypothetical protein